MNLQQAFLELIKATRLDSDKFTNTIKSLTKKLNYVYYNSDSDTAHFVYGGSYGRGTANKFSDIDYCYILPNDVYERFQNRKGNIQSQLISEIKSKVEQRYPNSEIKGDGQVVVINLKKIKIELVPSFKLNPYDNLLTYPDTNDDGSWLTTNPIEQHNVVKAFNNEHPTYKKICKIIRCWKVQKNVRIKGIIIDCLVKQYIGARSDLYEKDISDVDIIELLKDFFSYLANSSPNYIDIIGENIFLETGKEKFAKKAKKAYNLLSETDPFDLWENCIYLFGAGFPDNPLNNESRNDEQFITDLFPVKIKYNLSINCDMSANGFRTASLKNLLSRRNATSKYIIDHALSLNFFIEDIDVPEPYSIYWKVRNVGREAVKRNDIRGKIEKGGRSHLEKSEFCGSHYVECYIVKDGTCVAKDMIDVPIK